MKEETIRQLNVLELEPGADFQSVKKSYKLLSMAWHPDRFSSEKHKAKAESKQKKINSAYHWIKNNQEILLILNENSTNKTSQQKSQQKTKARKQSNQTSYKRENRSYYNSRVKFDDLFLIFEDQKYEFDLIEKAFLSINSRKYIRGIGYTLFTIGWIFFMATFLAFYREWDDAGFTFILLFFLSFIFAPFFGLIKDIVKINLILKNKSIVTGFSYKVIPNTNEAQKKYKIARRLVNEINNVIKSK